MTPGAGGPVVLVGGAEFLPGNEDHDRLLAAAAGDGPALILPTAAARQVPERAVEQARRWFAGLGVAVEELPVLRPADAHDAGLAERAAAARVLYLTGGDPGLLVRVLRESPVWRAMARAWRSGAALAGSSAGAMALCRWTLLRDSWPDRRRRRYAEALGLIGGTVLLPHFDTFGHRWVESAQAGAPAPQPVLLGIDERTAAVWDGAGWRASGAGAVTVIHGGATTRHAAGAEVPLVPAPG